VKWLEQPWHDLRHACRLLLSSPGFSSIAVVSLAIGIGATCAIFSFADGLLLRPLPVSRPSDVLTVGSVSAFETLNIRSLVSSYPDYVDIRDRNKSFEGLAAFSNLVAGFASEPGATPKLKAGLLVSANLMPLMGVEPTIGRSFRPDEDQVPGRDAVVVLSRALWEQEFASDAAVLGRTVRVNNVPFTVIGVAPGAFTGMDQNLRADFFVPLMMSPRVRPDQSEGSLENRGARGLRLKGRLRPHISQAQAQAELTGIGADLQRAYPDTNKNRTLLVRTEIQTRIAADPPDSVMAAMLALLAIAVLLVACGNVGGLLTSRAPARAREMALRLAIGAGRAQLVRQLIIESVVIAVTGGMLGLGVAYVGLRLFKRIELPTDLPIMLDFQLDRRALLFSLAMSLASAVIFGVVPAIQAARTDLAAVLKASDAMVRGRRRWGRTVLVGGQVAASVFVLVIAMFTYRGFGREMAAGPGYRIDHLLMMSFDPTLVGYSETQSQQLFQQAADRARAVPGVAGVTMTTSIPMFNDSFGTITLQPEGFEFPPGQENTTVLSGSIDEYYFNTLRIPIVAGRNFSRKDDGDAPRVAIVNQRFAEHFWPNQNPLGKRLRLAPPDNAWIEVVGLAKTSKYVFFAESPIDFVYLPYRQRNPRRIIMVAQSDGDPAGLTTPLREAIRSLDANLPIFNVRTMESLYNVRATRIFEVLVTIVGGMGLMGLVLSIVGLYGLVAYGVSRRQREIGIRMAIGASSRSVLGMVLQQGFILAVIGLVVGLAGGMAAGNLMRAAFPANNDSQDLIGALVIVVPVVLVVTAVATYVPARRAARINPTEALRCE
jgi:predicted permease